MLSSLRKNGLASILKEVRVFKVGPCTRQLESQFKWLTMRCKVVTDRHKLFQNYIWSEVV